MAAPTIKIKRSAVSGNAPTTAQLELGELALNTYDGKLFTEINTGSPSIVEIGSNLSTLNVSGAADFAGAVDIAGATGISGATTLSGTTGISGAATFTNGVTFDNGSNAGRDIQWQPSNDRLSWFDNAKATWGDGADLSIYHDGTTSYITNTNGFFRIKGDDIKLEAANGEDMIECDANGTVRLYHNNSYKLATASYGIYVSGKVLASNGADFLGDVKFDGATAGRDIYFDRSEDAFEFRDNAKAIFGTGSDLSIYHSGSHSFIDDSGTGNLKVRSNNLRFSNTDESKIYGTFTPTSVDLYYNNTKRFNTSVIGVEVTGHSELDNIKSVGIATFSNNAIHANVYSTGISTISGLRFPSSDGSEDQALVTDGSGTLSFKTLSGSGGATGTATTISAGVTTATQGQTAFTTVHPHNDGTTARSVQVFINGIKQRPSGAGNATKDFTASSNSTITLHGAATLGDEVRTVVYYNHTIDEEYFTATEGQTLFTLTGSSAAQKYFRVYLNGTKLRNGTDYGVAAPVTLLSACKIGDHVEIVCDDAEDAFVATEAQTQFTPTATTITEDNMQVFLNGVQLSPTIDYSIGDPAVTFADAIAANVGDQVDVCIRRS